MRVLLKVWSSNPDYDGGCDYAAVEISEELAKLMLRRINVFSEQKPSIVGSMRRITGTLRRSISVPRPPIRPSRARLTRRPRH